MLTEYGRWHGWMIEQQCRKLPDVLQWATRAFKGWETDLPSPEVWQKEGPLDGPGPPPGSKTDSLSWRPQEQNCSHCSFTEGWPAGSSQRQWSDHLQPASWEQPPFNTTIIPTFPGPGTLCCLSGLVCTSSAMDKATVGQAALHWWVSTHLSFNDERVRVRRRQGERFHGACVREHARYDGGSLRLWGGLGLNNRNSCNVCKGIWSTSATEIRQDNTLLSSKRKFAAKHTITVTCK